MVINLVKFSASKLSTGLNYRTAAGITGTISKVNITRHSISNFHNHNNLKMDDIQKISDCVVKKYPEGDEVQMKQLWATQRCVITYFRRQGASELSKILPLLEANNVRLIGIGLEEVGVHDFIAGRFFKGELFVDMKQEQYKKLEFRKFNVCNIWAHMFNMFSRSSVRKAKKEGIRNNWEGNGFQTGGTLVVEKGGTVPLLVYKQQSLADHLETSKILEALGIPYDEAVIDSQPGRRDSEYSGHNTD